MTEPEFRFSTSYGRVISLRSRQDRRERLLENLGLMGFEPGDFSFKDAVPDEFHGGIGCAKSHCEVLVEFILHRREEFLIVLEDDFEFRKSKSEVEKAVTLLCSRAPDWRVFLLSGSYVVKIPKFESAGCTICQIFQSQTTSGYVVRRDFALALLSCFLEALDGLTKYRNIRPYNLVYARFAIDQQWKFLQGKGGWYSSAPMLGAQSSSYSDIEKKTVDYNDFSA